MEIVLHDQYHSIYPTYISQGLVEEIRSHTTNLNRYNLKQIIFN